LSVFVLFFLDLIGHVKIAADVTHCFDYLLI
jgi:hypothetical protein